MREHGENIDEDADIVDWGNGSALIPSSLLLPVSSFVMPISSALDT